MIIGFGSMHLKYSLANDHEADTVVTKMLVCDCTAKEKAAGMELVCSKFAQGSPEFGAVLIEHKYHHTCSKPVRQQTVDEQSQCNHIREQANATCHALTMEQTTRERCDRLRTELEIQLICRKENRSVSELALCTEFAAAVYAQMASEHFEKQCNCKSDKTEEERAECDMIAQAIREQLFREKFNAMCNKPITQQTTEEQTECDDLRGQMMTAIANSISETCNKQEQDQTEQQKLNCKEYELRIQLAILQGELSTRMEGNQCTCLCEAPDSDNRPQCCDLAEHQDRLISAAYAMEDRGGFFGAYATFHYGMSPVMGGMSDECNEILDALSPIQSDLIKINQARLEKRTLESIVFESSSFGS